MKKFFWPLALYGFMIHSEYEERMIKICTFCKRFLSIFNAHPCSQPDTCRSPAVVYSLVSHLPQNTVSLAVPWNSPFPQIFSMAVRMEVLVLP